MANVLAIHREALARYEETVPQSRRRHDLLYEKTRAAQTTRSRQGTRERAEGRKGGRAPGEQGSLQGHNQSGMLTFIRLISKESKSEDQKRRKRNGTKRWPRKCTTNESSASSGERSATSCCIREQLTYSNIALVCLFPSIPVYRAISRLIAYVYIPLTGFFYTLLVTQRRLEMELRLQYRVKKARINQRIGIHILY